MFVYCLRLGWLETVRCCIRYSVPFDRHAWTCHPQDLGHSPEKKAIEKKMVQVGSDESRTSED